MDDNVEVGSSSGRGIRNTEPSMVRIRRTVGAADVVDMIDAMATINDKIVFIADEYS